MVEFHVLRCAQCQTFQVLQVTKTTKWKCKMCGLKQSVTKVYGQGSGADCRRHVQKLNSLCGQITKTAEEQHLISAIQTPVDCGFSSPDHVISAQQETIEGSRWSSFVDESDDETHTSLLNDVGNNGSVVKVTTDWVEYQETKNSWRKRRAERNNGFSKQPGKKSKIFTEHTNMSDRSGQESYGVQYNQNSTVSSVDCALDNRSSMFSSKAYSANPFYVSSLAIEEDKHNNVNSPYQFSARLEADGASSVEPNIGYSSNKTCDHKWTNRDLSRNMSVDFLGAKKTRTNQNKRKTNSKLVSKTPATSKWDAFIETEQHDDDDGVITFSENSDNIDTMTDSKLPTRNSHSLSVGLEHVMQEKQSVYNTQQRSSVPYSHKFDEQNKLENKPNYWLKESKSSDWLKGSNPSDWLKEIKSSDWLKKSKPNDWLTGSGVKTTAVSNSTHSAVISNSSSFKVRGAFDLGLEIFDEDLRL